MQAEGGRSKTEGGRWKAEGGSQEAEGRWKVGSRRREEERVEQC